MTKETRQGWECGVYIKMQIEWLQKTIEGLQKHIEDAQEQINHKEAIIKAFDSRGISQTAAVKIPTSAERHHDMLSSMAHRLSELSENDRNEVIGMAKAWAAQHTYASNDDPAKRLALEVSRLNGYGLGAFMQHLMSLGAENQKAMFEKLSAEE